MIKYQPYIASFILLCLSITAMAQDGVQDTVSFQSRIMAIFPEAQLTEIPARDHFKESFTMVLKTPLDHQDAEAGSFDHYIYLSHAGKNEPTVLVTEGYNAVPRTYELSSILNANQVQVEYRFYGRSRPDSIPWVYLKNDQAIEDYHHLVEKLKTLYTGKWISTGISKGGETVLIYKSKYPDDVDMSVPYVAPLINGQEDPRTEEHIKTIGSKQCRDKISAFQRLVLEKRDSVLIFMNDFANKEKMEFNIVPLNEALEYSVLEFPFSFWQWGGVCDDIPDKKVSAHGLFEYMNSIVGIKFYNDETYEELLPSYYQHMTELGYYGFDTTPVKDLLQVVHHPTNMRFAPKNIDMSYNKRYIKKVRNYVENKGDRILYIYGEFDTWGACAPSPGPGVDALKMVLAKGSHKTRIKDFSTADQDIIFNRIRTWLGPEVKLLTFKDQPVTD